jgi:hypothetical protein
MAEAEVGRLTSVRSLPELVGRYSRRRGTPLVRSLLAAARLDGITRSELEEWFLEFLERNGFSRPALNADLALGGGRFVNVDCLWRERRVALELDSRTFHDRSLAFESDRARDRRLTAADWKPMRVTWLQLRDEPDEVAADLRRALLV